MAKRKRTKRQAKFEDTKGVIKSHQLTKDIEYNSQKKIRTKRQTHIYQTLQRELKIEQQGRHKNKVVYHFIDYFCVTPAFNHRCVCLYHHDRVIVIMISTAKRLINTVITKT
jgi:hypothetical protein